MNNTKHPIHDVASHILRCDSENDILPMLKRYGVASISNIGISTPYDLSDSLTKVFGKNCLISYTDKVSPRTELSEKIYTSTDFPANASIFFHNGNCAKISWPLYIAFYCKTKPESGGNTTVTSIRQVTQNVPEEIRQTFSKKGILYTRNLGGVVGNSIEANFGVTCREDVEKICHDSKIEFEWTGRDSIRLRYHRQPMMSHPITGEELWFNNIVFWDAVSLDRLLRRALSRRPIDQLPFKTYFGDGSPIPEAWLETLIKLYNNAQVPFDWEEDCLLVLDNMMFAHGRERFNGNREVWVAMSEEIHLD